MFFDIIVLILVILAFIKGYSKGLVSTVLALGLYAASFFAVMYINSKFLIIQTPMGLWGQGAILFLIFSILSSMLVKMVNFEDLVVLGFFSKVLGSLLHGVITLAIIMLILTVLITVNGTYEFLNNGFFEGSQVIEWARKLLQQLPLLQGIEAQL